MDEATALDLYKTRRNDPRLCHGAVRRPPGVTAPQKPLAVYYFSMEFTSRLLESNLINLGLGTVRRG